MWQQPGLLEHPDRHRPHVVKGRVIPTLVEPLPRLVPPRFGPVTKGEKRFLATQLRAAPSDVEYLVGLQAPARRTT